MFGQLGQTPIPLFLVTHLFHGQPLQPVLAGLQALRDLLLKVPLIGKFG